MLVCARRNTCPMCVSLPLLTSFASPSPSRSFLPLSLAGSPSLPLRLSSPSLPPSLSSSLPLDKAVHKGNSPLHHPDLHRTTLPAKKRKGRPVHVRSAALARLCDTLRSPRSSESTHSKAEMTSSPTASRESAALVGSTSSAAAAS